MKDFQVFERDFRGRWVFWMTVRAFSVSHAESMILATGSAKAFFVSKK